MKSKFEGFFKSEFFFHFRRNVPAIIGFIIVVIALFIAVFGRQLAPQNPYDMTAIELSDAYIPPVWEEGGVMKYPLGTDNQGRCMLSAIIYGSVSSITIGILGMLFSCTIGTFLGLCAGYYGGRVDSIIMRIADVQLSFPS
ncbi:MAG: ABC transporter permease, partial [Oscillospiraceae bacterium]